MRRGTPLIPSALLVALLSRIITGRFRDGQKFLKWSNRGAKLSGPLPICEEPGCSDFGSLRQGKRVFDIDAEIAHRVLDLGVTK